MTGVKLEEVKRYCGIDDCSADNDIYDLIEAAKEYLKTAGITKSESQRYKLAVKGLVLHWYDAEAQIKPALQQLITQLKLEAI